MFRHRSGLFLILAGLVVGSSLPLRAQSISGIIAGTVRDPSHAALSAVITATDGHTGKSYTAQGDANGNYRLIEVPPGFYNVKAESLGFRTFEYQNVQVDVDRTTDLNFQLALAPAPTPVTTVRSIAPYIDTTSPTLRTNFDDTDVRQLPILTRDVNNLALLAPGMADVRTFSFGSTLVPFASNGSRGRDNNFIIDSVSNNEPLLGGAAAQFTNTDVFTEYTVLTNQLKAEFGRNSGATINAITKAGYERTHGSLFWFGQLQRFNALTRAEQGALLATPAHAYENVGGFTLGGPVLKSNPGKLLYFVSYQWDGALNNISSVFPVLNTLPTPTGLAALQGLPSNPALTALLNTPTVYKVPATTAPCFGSVPTADNTGQVLNPCFPPTNVNVRVNGNVPVQYGVYLVPHGNLFNQHDHQASGRLDYRISNSDDVYGRYLFDDLRTPRATLNPAGESAFSDLGLLSYWRDFYHQRTQSMLLNERHQWLNSLNELRGSFVRVFMNDGALKTLSSVREAQASATVADNFGGFGAFTGNFPAAGTVFTLGDGTRPNRTASNIAEVQDNFSLIRGNKSYKFGADFIRTQTNVRNVPDDLGHYFFSANAWLAGIQRCSRFGGLTQFADEGSGGCNPAVATNAAWVYQRIPDVITDGAGNVTGLGPEELQIREFDEFVFGQVDWRVKPNLTLNLGLRYENYGQPINSLGLLNPAAPRVRSDNNNLGPRVGFAWSPWNWRNTVFRGGYGVMYDPMALNIPLTIWQSGPISPLVQYFGAVNLFQAQLASIGVNVPLDAKSAVTPSGTFPNLPFTAADLKKAPTVPGCDIFNRLASFNPVINCADQVTVDHGLQNPYFQEWSASVQHSVSPNLFWEADYVGNRGVRNYQRVDTNPFQGYNDACLAAVSSTGNPLVPPGDVDECLFDRLEPNRGDIQAITNGGFSTYHAFEVSVTRRTAHRAGDLAFTASYTLSHMIDNSSEAFSSADVPEIGPTQILANYFAAGSQRFISVSTPLPQDSTNLHAEKANSSYDHRHRLAISFVYQLPSADHWKALLNGWQLNGIEEFQTGQPFTPLNGRPLGNCVDAFGEGILTNDRPAIGNPSAPFNSVALVDDATCRSVDAATQTQLPGQLSPNYGYVDLNGNPIDPRTAHFVQAPLGFRAGQPFVVPIYANGLLVNNETFVAGSAGRNTLFGPKTQNLDLALYKEFAIGESKHLQFRWEVYDVLNRPNPGFPIGNVFAARAQQTFGYAFSARATPAGVTGLTPESTIDAFTFAGGKQVNNFLSTQYMNTSARTMQFGVHLIF